MTGIGAGGAVDRERLQAISEAADQATLDVIRSLLPKNCSARVTDVGCGTGSVAVALARNRPGDSVWAVDQDVSLIPASASSLPNLYISHADVRSWVPDTDFDVVHARFLLSHLSDREEVLQRLMSWVVPSGHIVITEPFHLDDGAHPAVQSVLSSYRRLVEADGLDFAFSRQAAGLMTRYGAQHVAVLARPTRLGGGDGDGVDKWSALVKRVEDRLTVEPYELELFYEFAASSTSCEIPQIILTTVGQRSTLGQAVQL